MFFQLCTFSCGAPRRSLSWVNGRLSSVLAGEQQYAMNRPPVGYTTTMTLPLSTWATGAVVLKEDLSDLLGLAGRLGRWATLPTGGKCRHPGGRRLREWEEEEVEEEMQEGEKEEEGVEVEEKEGVEEQQQQEQKQVQGMGRGEDGEVEEGLEGG